ncbi:MAG: peptidoglycan DD-metalloendopeptidase family protein [Clostridia bacterium]|nr:peptidoglycan DD-metalloendopeptidase family protein [Clostridia bacterium]
MQYSETNLRGNGYIISGDGLSVPPSRKRKRFNYSFNIYNNLSSHIKSTSISFKKGFSEYVKTASLINKRFISLSLSFGVAACSLCVFFSYFTFATAIYSPEGRVAYSDSLNAFHSSLAVVEKKVKSTNATLSEFKTIPAICLKSSLTSNSALSDKLLLCSPEYTEGYSLLSDGEIIFTSKTKEEAQSVLNEYVSLFSMNGNASVETSIEFKKRIVPVSLLSSKEESLNLLSQNKQIPVVSVVSSAQEESIPFTVETTEDSSLYIGETVTVTEGKNGTKKIYSETTYVNGEIEDSRISSENVVSQPVTKVVKIGTKEKDILKTGVLRPVSGGRISSRFGPRWGRTHQGLDIAVPTGTSIIAAEGGTVSYASENAGGYGKLVKIKHSNGVETAYAHLSKIIVTKGQVVSAGELIALSGNTGNSTGPHLHFEIISNGVRIDPEPYIK